MISPLEPNEAGAVIALWRAAGLTRPWNDPAADVALALAGPSSAILAARDEEGRLLGTVMAGFDGHRGWIYYLAVAEAERGRGLGRALVTAAEAWLAAQGAPKIQLMIRAENERVAAFYAALGYEPGDVMVMGKRLDD